MRFSRSRLSWGSQRRVASDRLFSGTAVTPLKFRSRNMATAVVKDTSAAGQEIDVMTGKALKGLEIFRTFNQEQVDKIIDAMTKAGVANERYLAEFAVEETGIG